MASPAGSGADASIDIERCAQLDERRGLIQVAHRRSEIAGHDEALPVGGLTAAAVNGGVDG